MSSEGPHLVWRIPPPFSLTIARCPCFSKSGRSARGARCCHECQASQIIACQTQRFIRKSNESARFASSNYSLHDCRSRFAGWISGCDLPDCAGVDRRDARLRRISRLFPRAGQPVCADWRNSVSSIRHAGVLQRIQLRHVRGFRLFARTNISHSDHRCDVPCYALAAVCAGLPASRVLSLLFVLSGDRFLASWNSRRQPSSD